MATKSTRYRKRAWLNRDRSKRAYVIAHVDGITKWEGSTHQFTEMGGTLEMGDCRKTIWLDFAISGPQEKANVLYKARLFREIVNTFLDQVEAEAAKSDFKPVKLKKDGTPKKNLKKSTELVEVDGDIAISPADIVGRGVGAIRDLLL